MKSFTSDNALKIAKEYKVNSLSGRWITVSHLEEVLASFTYNTIQKETIGFSEEGRDIYQLRMGDGPKKILIWTQMHGNESTGTKAMVDLLNYMNALEDEISSYILSQCTIKIIPILNPDGAEKYTRVNTNNIDLNRDAVHCKAIESKLLRAVLDSFQPDFCFNLHDQRSIFGVEGTKNPAIISFLAPSEEITRKVTRTRKTTMNVIVSMNRLLQEIIPNHIGRYTDEFYPTATGDNFQKLGYPTILIESGHHGEDYERESVREYTCMAVLQGLLNIASTNTFKDYRNYFAIPNNNKRFIDLLYRIPNSPDKAFQLKEKLINHSIEFIPEEVIIDISEHFFHKEIDFEP